MPVTPAGPLSLPLSQARDMVAGLTAFQDWIGATGTDAEKLTSALARVFMLVAPTGTTRPYAIVDFVDLAHERDRVQGRRAFQMRSGSSVVVWFEDDTTDGLDANDAALDFCNRVGAVWSGLELAAAEPGKLLINVIDLVAPPARVEEEKRNTEGDYFEAAFSLAMTRRPE